VPQYAIPRLNNASLLEASSTRPISVPNLLGFSAISQQKNSNELVGFKKFSERPIHIHRQLPKSSQRFGMIDVKVRIDLSAGLFSHGGQVWLKPFTHEKLVHKDI
jgi:hypothetical protein